MKFKPVKEGPPTRPKYVRVLSEDLAVIKKLAKESGMSESTVIRQAIHHALTEKS